MWVFLEFTKAIADKFQFVGWVKNIANTNEIRVGIYVPPFNLYIGIKKSLSRLVQLRLIVVRVKGPRRKND